ncbi:hypothetical protein GQ55_2G056500 [Panicum hallii var. hallii]|uniref:Amine oxidase n=1 Tax=Panicum hallii var. hallii TaxID=1504633 RepID=A0A2T7ELU0_9POAL|nr:hypothetical protein GQ55_2G056500 [Panicum hallii var. hallii]
MWPLLLLPFLLAAAANASAADAEPPPAAAMAPWPEQFHAVVVTNLTARGGRLEVIDLYYDWPRGRDLNLVRLQLPDGGEPPLRNVEWANGTAYVFDAASCRTFQFAVGLLPPDWKARGAAYLGRARVDGFDCHVWSNFLFALYYEDVATGRPVAWNFMGMERHVLSFEPGGVLEDASMWQAPAYCFDGSNDGDAADGVDGQGSRADLVNSMIRFAGAPAAAASFDQ